MDQLSILIDNYDTISYAKNGGTKRSRNRKTTKRKQNNRRKTNIH